MAMRWKKTLHKFIKNANVEDPVPHPTRTGRACIGVAGFGFKGVQLAAISSSVGHAIDFFFAEVHQKKANSRGPCAAPHTGSTRLRGYE